MAVTPFKSTVGENLAIAENRILHTHFTALCVTDAELLTMEFSHSALVLIPLQVYWMVVDLFCSLTLTWWPSYMIWCLSGI